MIINLCCPTVLSSESGCQTINIFNKSYCHRSDVRIRDNLNDVRSHDWTVLISILVIFSLHSMLANAVLIQKNPGMNPNLMRGWYGQNTSNIASNFSFVGVHLAMPEITGGHVYKLSANINRLHTPWFKPYVVYLPKASQSEHRYLYSPVRRGAGDGLGHAMATINLEVTLALILNLTYTHRVSDYSSLTRKSASAVEAFFGWGDGEMPRKFVQTNGCFPRKKSGKWPSLFETLACQECGSPMVNGSLGIKHVVDLPREIAQYCLVLPDCKERIERFFKIHPHSHTIFQLPSSMCGPAMVNSDFKYSKNFFFHKYWRRHGRLLWYSKAPKLGHLRQLRINPDHLHIALHVRRGDFLLPQSGRLHHITHDEVFAKILRQVLEVIHSDGGPFSKLPVMVHIYSEGMRNSFQGKSLHDTSAQDKNYYDGHGTKRNVKWWEHLLYNKSDTYGFQKVADAHWPKLQFQMHISEDTLISAHEMISADIFIGSFSGLSTHLVWSLARGITILPTFRTVYNTSIRETDSTCCTVLYSRNGEISVPLLSQFWTAYAQANDATVQF